MHRTRTLLLIAVAASTLIASGCGVADSPGATPTLSAAPSLVPTTPPTDGGLAPGESITVPMSEEVILVVNGITAAVGSDPEFGNLEIDDVSGGLLLRWYGEPPEALLSSIRADHPTVPVELRQVDLLPGDLRDAARQLLESEHDAGVGAAGVRNDCTGITVMVDEDRATEDLDDLAARLTAKAGYPVDIELGAPVAGLGAVTP